jgi:hypothetical protein
MSRKVSWKNGDRSVGAGTRTVHEANHQLPVTTSHHLTKAWIRDHRHREPGVIYDTKGPGAVLGLAALVAAAGSLALLGRAGAAISFPPAGSVDLAGEREPGSAGTVARRGRWGRNQRPANPLT